MSLLYRGAQSWMQHFCGGLPHSEGKGHGQWPGDTFPSAPRSFSTKLLSRWSATSIKWYMRLFLHRNFPGEMCISFCWTSLDSCPSKYPPCPSEWQHTHQVYQPLLVVLCHLQTCWGCMPWFFWVINEDIKQYWTHYRSLVHTAGDWPPTGLNSADHNPRPSASDSSQCTAAYIHLAEGLSSLLMTQLCLIFHK